MSDRIKMTYSDAVVRGLLRGKLGAGEGGPLVVPPDGDDAEAYLRFNGIQVERRGEGSMRVALLWDAMTIGHFDVPEPDVGCTVTLAGAGIDGRHPFSLTAVGA